MAQLCLSVAVTAAHRDMFFIKYLAEHCSDGLILASPNELDEKISGQPSAFMAQGILTYSSTACELLIARYPSLISQLVPQLPPDQRLETSVSYPAAMKASVLSEDAISPMDAMQLPEFIFFVGSGDHCRLLQKLRANAGRRGAQQGPSQPNHPAEARIASSNDIELGLQRRPTARENEPGRFGWKSSPLTRSEFHWLLLGLIANGGDERLSLWGLVKSQTGPKSGNEDVGLLYYVRLAIRYGNNKALEELLNLYKIQQYPKSLTWKSNFVSPLDLALFILSDSKHFGVFPAPRSTPVHFRPADQDITKKTIEILGAYGLKSPSKHWEVLGLLSLNSGSQLSFILLYTTLHIGLITATLVPLIYPKLVAVPEMTVFPLISYLLSMLVWGPLFLSMSTTTVVAYSSLGCFDSRAFGPKYRRSGWLSISLYTIWGLVIYCFGFFYQLWSPGDKFLMIFMGLFYGSWLPFIAIFALIALVAWLGRLKHEKSKGGDEALRIDGVPTIQPVVRS
ncbi:hypothetical protein QBC40DRAFT_265438 [Triangularia verruculosa]|uniref:Uncharacterized protein n=1 Tax=Triangularia verruculosa TaxID=2587418 RepID=A0AAN6XK54_9PEZI|nr:hypothetical protein QBC40DRAFT_265438 [Triangularia verruculosa]